MDDDCHTSTFLYYFCIGVNPEQEYRAVYRLMTYLWIIIGLAWLSTVISLFQDLVQNAITKVDQKVDEKLGVSYMNHSS